MSKHKPFKLGVVEGFFGISWSWQARTAYAEFLVKYGFQAYLYAPKNDQYLRQDWHQPFPDSHKQALRTLSAQYAQAGLDFGLGLSPFELYRDFNVSQQTKLKNKLREINEINPATLCILFDDMRGDVPHLAQQQVNIIDFISEHSNAQNISMCPTYYSEDPALSHYFGEAPANYLEELGQKLDSEVDIFWTGPKVCSIEYPEEHLLTITQKLQRKPALWDNYPVNDSKALTPFLHLQPLKNRGVELKKMTSSHYANPMNQAFLSQLPLHCLRQQLAGSTANIDELLQQACHDLCPATLNQLIVHNLGLFQDQGLDNISIMQKAELISRFDKHQQHPMAREIIDWLQGKYIFDPACLT